MGGRMGFTVLPLAMTNGFLTDSVTIYEEVLPVFHESGKTLPSRVHRPDHQRVRHLLQSPAFHVPRVFHPTLRAAGPLRIDPIKMPPYIIDEIKRRQDEANIDRRPYAPSPLPPGEFPPDYERPQSQHRNPDIDGNTAETGERGVVIIDFEI